MKKIILLLLISATCSVVRSQSVLPPVYVPVANVNQQSSGWCWAAVAEQILRWKKHKSPKQCELVSEFGTDTKETCCSTPSVCSKPGNLQQLQLLFNQFGIQYSSLLPLPNSQSLYSILNDRAVIMFVQSSSIAGHCIVIVGMDGGNVIVNDPTGTYQTLPLETILSLWSVAIAI